MNPIPLMNFVEERAIDNVIKALIVDDSTIDRLILQKLLLRNGFDVCLANDGHMALQMYAEYKPDIVFMDLYLPESSGYEITKKLKQLSHGAYVPVIFVTATSDDVALEKCLDSGGDDFIVKPIKDTLLKAKVGSLLRIKKMHDKLQQERDAIAAYNALQEKDLYDAEGIINNIHKPLFYNSGNLDWSFVAKDILTGDIICSARGPTGNHIILVGDNTGHGLPAAIAAQITCEVFYTMVGKGFETQLIIEEINKKLYYLLSTDRFLAACIIETDDEYEVIKIWNEGLPDIIICHPDRSLKQKVPSMNLPLGIELLKHTDVAPVRINLEQGDYVYVYTDGLTEVFNEAGEMYGEQRLLGSIQSDIMSENRVATIIDNTKSFRAV